MGASLNSTKSSHKPGRAPFNPIKLSIQPPIPIVTILPQNTKTGDEFSKEFKPLIEKELPVSALKTEVKALRILYKAK